MERGEGDSVYILASKSPVLYTGVTSNLMRRTAQHRFGLTPGFSSKYRTHRLVHIELHGDIRNAIRREKEIKGWRREKRIALIEKDNPTWDDLAEEWFGKRTARADLPQSHAGHKMRASSSRHAGTRSP